MAYKIMFNNSVVDAQEFLKYVRWNDTEEALYPCHQEEANGIMSTDELSVWHLEGCPEFPKKVYKTVTAIEISEDEYTEILSRLNIVSPMTVEQMRSKIISLEEELSATKILLGVT